MILYAAGLAIVYLFMRFTWFKVIPFLNKHIFAPIWSEESVPVTARETIDRIKDLCIDGDVSEDTAVLIAAQENKTTEGEILKSFNADDAKELVRIISGRPQGTLSVLLKQVKNAPRKGMKGR